jgi:6-phosphogluconolactonase
MPAIQRLLCGLYFIVTLSTLPYSGRAAEMLVYFGTYTGDRSHGIYVSRLDSMTGELTAPDLAGEATNPSFLAMHPSGRFLYAVGEVSKIGDTPGGAVTSFEIQRETGRLRRLNEESSRGAGPCHIVVDPSGRWVLVANYGGGSVAVLPIREDGHVGAASSFVQHHGSSVNRRRQAEPHAHSINVDAANRFAVAADLGLDQLLVYAFDAEKGGLTLNSSSSAALPPGSGPRHFAFHPRGRHAFCINELLSTLSAFRYEPATGKLELTDNVSTLPAGHPANNSTAEVQVHPSGRFVYGSNRGHDSIAAFRFDRRRGKLEPIDTEPTQGRTPRNFGIDPTGRWLLAANQESDSVVVFRIHASRGTLEPAGHSIEVGSPVCVKFLRVD